MVLLQFDQTIKITRGDILIKSIKLIFSAGVAPTGCLNQKSYFMY
jgi:hypothetical protein